MLKNDSEVAQVHTLPSIVIVISMRIYKRTCSTYTYMHLQQNSHSICKIYVYSILLHAYMYILAGVHVYAHCMYMSIDLYAH